MTRGRMGAMLGAGAALSLACAGPAGHVRGDLRVDGVPLRPTACVVEPPHTIIVVSGNVDVRDVRATGDGQADALLRLEKGSGILVLEPQAHRRLPLGRCATVVWTGPTSGEARFDCETTAPDAVFHGDRELGPGDPAPTVRVRGDVRFRDCTPGPVDGF